MKNLIFSLLTFICFQNISFAKELSQDLYEALNVPEVDVSVGAGAEIFKKEISGINCQKIQIIYPNALPTFSCIFDTKTLDSKKLYNSLNIEEVLLDDQRVGVEIFFKKMDGIRCEKITVVYPNAQPRYECKITLKF